MEVAPDWNQMPIWLIAIVVILKVVFDFVGKWTQKGKDSSPPIELKLRVVLSKLDGLEKHVSDLHDWHGVRDPDGVFLWYNRRSTEKAIEALVDVLGDVRQALSDLHNENKQQTEILKKVVENQHRQDERFAKLSADLPRLRATSSSAP